MAKISLSPITNVNTLSAVNANFSSIASELQNKVLYRANPVGEPNSVNNDLDLNGNDIFNVGLVATTDLTVDGQTIEQIVDAANGGVVAAAEAAKVAAQAAATAAATSAGTASTAATNAGNSATAAAGSASAASGSASSASTSATNANNSAVAAAASAASIAGGPVASYNGRTGIVVPIIADKIPLAINNVDNTSDVNKPVSTAQAAADLVVFNNTCLGQCSVIKSGANLLLLRNKGTFLSIQGTNRQIPAAGITLAPTGAVAGTTYYIYAFWTGSAIQLEFSTTGHSTDTTTGIEIKTGDATRTLVAQARAITGPAWQDTIQQRFVISWFNRRPISLQGVFTAPRATSSATYTEPNAEIRTEFLAWSGDPVSSTITGELSHSVANIQVRTVVGLDGSQGEGHGTTLTAAIGNVAGVSAFFCYYVTEGYHFASLLGSNIGAAGVVTYGGSATPGTRCALQTIIQG